VCHANVASGEFVKSNKSDVINGASREMLFYFNEHPTLGAPLVTREIVEISGFY